MERYKLTLAYDGATFAGSQRQARARTVQSELERALRQLGWSGRSVTLAGRTDSGVHASGQVAAFDLEWAHGADRLREALNAGLPHEMAALRVETARPDFHPRFDASSRRYRYRLFCAGVRDPLQEPFAWRVWPAVEGAVLCRTAGLFVGQHDFAAFGSPVSKSGNTVRTVLRSEWRQVEAEWQYEIQADAFLYRMVRRLVFAQVAVAQGRCLPENVAGSLNEAAPANSKNGIPAGLAPAHGLTLIEVIYPQMAAQPE